MHSRLLLGTAATSLVMLLLVGMINVNSARPGQQLVGTLSGQLISAGTQAYEQKGGRAVAGEILGSPLDPNRTSLTYSLDASLTGLNVSGGLSIELTGWTLTGVPTHISGRGVIMDMIPALQLPIGCDGKAARCTSAIAAFFTGLANLSLSEGAERQNLTAPFVFESAYLNPFGSPLLFELNHSTWITATYTDGKITWSGVVVGGSVAASLGSTPVDGAFTQISRAEENLVTGNESETGRITFTGMTPSSLNSVGQFSGTSKIPSGVTICPAMQGVPFLMPSDTCAETGLSSKGNFSTSSQTGKLSGSYVIEWPAPAFTFEGAITATPTFP